MMIIKKITHPGNLLLLGFGILLILMVMLVSMSLRQHVTLVNKNYYEQELQYQKQLDAGNNAAVFDTAFRIARADGRLLLWLPVGLSRTAEQGSLYLYCPSDERLDRRQAFGKNRNGIYIMEHTPADSVEYIAKVSFSANGKSYYRELKLHAK